MTKSVLVDERVVAGILSCRVKTLQAWRHRGGGPPFIKVGALVRYQMSDLDQWIASQRRESTSDRLSGVKGDE